MAKMISNPEIDELIQEYQRTGDERAFEKVYDAFKGQIAYHASKFSFYSIGSDDIQMIIEFVLFQAARTWKNDQGARFKTYFWTCVHNEMISVKDKTNTQSRAGERTLASLDAPFSEDGDGTLADVIPARQTNHADQVVLHESIRKIAEGNLKPLDKTVVLLLLENPTMTQVDVAKVTGKSDIAISDSMRRLRDCAPLREVLSLN